MIASNGLRPAFRLSSVSCRSLPLRTNGLRKFSSLPEPARGISTPQSRAQHTSPLLSSRWRSTNIAAPTLLATASGIRFNSTTPTPPASATSVEHAANAAHAEHSWAVPHTPDSTIEDLLDTAPLSSVPETIGYLKSLGLDYGWGPTAVAEWLLEHIHVWSGMPWGLSILAAAFTVRVGCFYFYVQGADTTAKMRALKPIIDPLNARMKMALNAGDKEGTMRYRRESQKVYKDMGIRPIRHVFAGPVLQGLLGFGAFRLSRGMADIPVPGFLDGGMLWFTNLAIPDPIYLLPLLTAGAVHMVARVGGETGAPLQPIQKKLMMYGLPGLTILFSWWLPAATQLTFLAGSVLSLLQALIFRQPRIRQALNLTPLYKPPVIRPPTIETRFAVRPQQPTAGRKPVYQAPSSSIGTAPDPLAPPQQKEAEKPGFATKLFTQAREAAGDMFPDALVRMTQSQEKQRRQRLKKQAELYEARRQAQIDEERRYRK